MSTLEAVVALPGVDEYMAEVEGRLVVAVGSHGGRVAAVGADALAAGGKRLRPLLAEWERNVDAEAMRVVPEFVRMMTSLSDVGNATATPQGRGAPSP